MLRNERDEASPFDSNDLSRIPTTTSTWWPVAPELFTSAWPTVLRNAPGSIAKEGGSDFTSRYKVNRLVYYECFRCVL